MTVQIDWNAAADADLVGGAAAGDRAAFAGIYDRYADRLYDFCWAWWATVTPPTACRKRSAWRLSICRHCAIPPNCVPGCIPSPDTRRCGRCAPVSAKRHPMSYPKSRPKMPVPTC